MLPLAFELRGAPVLVIGAGVVGVGKAASLIDAGADVTMLASSIDAPLPEGLARVLTRPYAAGDLAGYHLVVSATGRPDVNDEIVAEARRERVWLNVVDDPARSTFFFMALHRQGEVTVAVTTEGASPALAQTIRARVAATLPTHLARVAATLRREREALHGAGVSTEGHDWRSRIDELWENDDAR